MRLITILLVFCNIAYSATPVITSLTNSCANDYCMTIRGLDFDADASVQVREDLSGSVITVFSGNDIYSRSFDNPDDKIFFPIQNLDLQDQWNNNGLCFTVNNNGLLSNEQCIVRTTNPIQPPFMGEIVESYNLNQDIEYTSFVVKGDASPLNGGNLLKIWGNSWKQINYDYTITPYSILKFEFKSNQQEAEINGIGLKMADGSEKHFQIFGTEDWQTQDYHNYSESGYRTYNIPVGEYFDFNNSTTGSKDVVKMFFTADEDTHVGQNVLYRNPKLIEQPPLDLDCDQVPLPEKIDCPNDEFFSLGVDRNTLSQYPQNTEAYAGNYQWAADYMDFAYGWYYTNGNARIGILDTTATLTQENSHNVRNHSIGTFASTTNLNDLMADHQNTGNVETHCQNFVLNQPDTYIWDESLGLGEATFGRINPNEQTLDTFPDIFINEYWTIGMELNTQQNPNDPPSAKLEIAIKDNLDPTVYSIEISNTNDHTLLTNEVPFTQEDLNTKVYNINNDFHQNYGSANGYKFYYIDKNSNPNFILDAQATDMEPGTTDHEQNGPGHGRTSAYGINDIVNIKINNTLIQSLTVKNSQNTNQLASCTRYHDELHPVGFLEHGSLILSILGSESDNTIGMSSFCKNCSLSFSDVVWHSGHYNSNDNELERTNDVKENLEHALIGDMSSGSQIINMSFEQELDNCNLQISNWGDDLDICDVFSQAKNRDILLFAAAGNNGNNYMGWPANEIDTVIGVAGTNKFGELFDIETWFKSSFDPFNTKFATPGQSILTHHPYGDFSESLSCIDSNFYPNGDGYQRCSGTSFSAPILASVGAMIRSINPLVPVDDIKQIMWDSKVQGLADQRYAIPRADKSVKLTLGKSGRNQLVNRLTPMFRMKSNSDYYLPGQISYLSTTIPQVAVAAKLGTYMETPEESTGRIGSHKILFSSDTSSPSTSGYDNYRGIFHTPRAPFYVFGGHRNPFNNEAADLLPLYHMAMPKFFGYNGYCNELGDHAYATERSNGFGGSIRCGQYPNNHLYEGIEGYILPTCPTGVDCYETSGNPNDAQCLKVRYSVQDNSFALMMASEVNKPMFQSYGTDYPNIYGQMTPISSLNNLENAECLGYVFPNVDTDNDGVIDGMELVLGTDKDNPDTDGDCLNDGTEYPLAGIPVSDPLIFDPDHCSYGGKQ